MASTKLDRQIDERRQSLARLLLRRITRAVRVLYPEARTVQVGYHGTMNRYLPMRICGHQGKFLCVLENGSLFDVTKATGHIPLVNMIHRDIDDYVRLRPLGLKVNKAKSPSAPRYSIYLNDPSYARRVPRERSCDITQTAYHLARANRAASPDAADPAGDRSRDDVP